MMDKRDRTNKNCPAWKGGISYEKMGDSMNDFDPTRLSDYSLTELYFDTLAQFSPGNERIETMRVELEGRDLLFEGYHICDWVAAPSFTVVGCKQTFKTLEQLKDYITACKGIEPTVDGDMHYL